VTLARYAEPSTVHCPRCQAIPDKACVDRVKIKGRWTDKIRGRYHVARENVPASYECRHCGGPFTVSMVTGGYVHSRDEDWHAEPHNAEPTADVRRWKP
jgi:rubredoxin